MNIQDLKNISEQADMFNSPFLKDVSRVRINELIQAVKQLDNNIKDLTMIVDTLIDKEIEK